MKKIFTSIFLFLIFCPPLFSQWQNKTLAHTSGLRQYRIYVPTNYSPANPTSLVLTLHGLGDNMTNFSGIGFDAIAQANNIIVVCPQALADPIAGTAWNSGAGFTWYTPNATIDDVGFISALIDTISLDYAVNPNKVFSCGFSMGGFMTEKLAIQLNGKIKAFASVAGTFGNAILPVAPGAPGRAVSIAHFHGTSDGTIGYTGNTYGMDAEPMVNYWKTNNQCNAIAEHELLPNTAADGYTVDHYKYTSPNNAEVIEFFKVNGADHVWLGPANDISYSREIWAFFNRYIQSTLSTSTHTQPSFTIYPNPATERINIEFSDTTVENYKLSLYDIAGREILSKEIVTSNGHYSLSLDSLNNHPGIYVLRLKSASREINSKIIIQ